MTRIHSRYTIKPARNSDTALLDERNCDLEPISDEELRALLADTESDRAERKQAVTDGEKIAQAICAFANDMPNHRRAGVLFINAKDDGTCANKPVDDRTILTLSDFRSNGNILPIPMMSVEKRTLDGNSFAVVTVMPADAPPVRFKGTAYVRVGPRRAIASAQEERVLRERQRANDLPFDIQPIFSSTTLDFEKCLFDDEYLASAVSPEVIAENGRSYQEQLASLRMVTAVDDPVPTLLGVLVLCSRVREFVPGAYVQFLRIQGTELSDPIVDESTIDGPLAQLIRRLDEKLASHTRTFVDITTASQEVRFVNYPLAALFQLTRNAIMHRTYEGTNSPVRVTWFEDRIEITSPAGPFGIVTKKNWGTAGVTDYRNPSIAEAMKTLGFVQRFGVGIATAARALEANGNPDMEWQVEDAYVAVTVRGRT